MVPSRADGAGHAQLAKPAMGEMLVMQSPAPKESPGECQVSEYPYTGTDERATVALSYGRPFMSDECQRITSLRRRFEESRR